MLKREFGYGRSNPYKSLAIKPEVERSLVAHLKAKARNRLRCNSLVECYIDESYLHLDRQFRYSWWKKSDLKRGVKAGVKLREGRLFVILAAGTVDALRTFPVTFISHS